MKRLTSFIILGILLSVPINGQSMTKIKAPEFPEYADWLNTERAYQLSDFHGKFVLLDFWTYCCINCIHILPDLKELEHKYSEELVVIGVHSPKFPGERETENIRQAILRYEIEHPVISDYQFFLWKHYGVRAWPTTVLIDPQGYVVSIHSGENIKSVWDAILEDKIMDAEQRGTLKRSAFTPTLERSDSTFLSFPGKVHVTPNGKKLVISDSNHNRILVADAKTGKVLITIGSGELGMQDGDFKSATFNHPQGSWMENDLIYIADTENHSIRIANLTKNMVTTLAGTGKQAQQFNITGTGLEVALNSPWDILFHDNKLYVAMAGSHQIWTINPISALAKPWLGSGREDIIDGPGYRAALAQPSGLAIDGDYLYFADSEVSAIRRGNLQDSTVETLIGKGLFEFGDIDGQAGNVRLQHPLGVVSDGKNRIFIADTYNNKIKALGLSRNSVSSFVGTGKTGTTDGQQATFDEPGGLTYANSKLYIADTNNHLIRVVDTTTRETSTLQIHH
jgi:DNA-binding beta-propeller fold protein YncE/thiol-disulfide isomerase/thioredoxin